MNCAYLIAAEVPEDLKEIVPQGARVCILPGNRGRIVEIPLAGGEGGECAKVTDHQARWLWNEGVRGRWFLNHNGFGKLYVRARCGGNTVMVARMLTGAGKGEVVSYRNGDPLDLRTENLESRQRPKQKADATRSPATSRKGLVVDPYQGAR